jgi:hypothetical protein
MEKKNTHRHTQTPLHTESFMASSFILFMLLLVKYLLVYGLSVNLKMWNIQRNNVRHHLFWLLRLINYYDYVL